MLTFAFIVLVLILAAGLAVFWFRYEIARERGIRRQNRRALLKQIKTLTDETATLTAKQTEFDKRFSELEIKARKEFGLPAPQAKDIFGQMEARHAKQLKQVVSIGEEPIDRAA